MSDILLPFPDNPFPRVVFVDCEASALARPSFPVEVGLAWCDGRTESHLVRPTEHWNKHYVWSEQSAQIHKIPREDLEKYGKDVEFISHWLNNELKGKVVCSDNPAFEAYWLSQVYRESGVKPQFSFVDSHHLVCAALQDATGSLAEFEPLKRRVMQSYPITHRAADDALFWAMLMREIHALGKPKPNP